MNQVMLSLFMLMVLSGTAQQTWYTNSTVDFNDPKPGQQLQLNYYHYDHLDPNKRTEDSVHAFIIRFPDLRFSIEFHSDCRADSAYNKQLTQRRADSMCAYIRRKPGLINLTCTGKGESEHVNGCGCEGNYVARLCTEEEHQQNRRTILRVVCREN